MATTTITANATTRRPAEITKASYAPLAVLALAQIGTSSDSAAMNLATASLVGTLGATLDDIQMATTLFSLIAGAFMIAGGLVGVTIGLRRALAMGLSLAVAGEMVAALSPNIFAFTWGGRPRCSGWSRRSTKGGSGPSRSAPSPERPRSRHSPR